MTKKHENYEAEIAQDVNEDASELVNVSDLITVSSIGCKPKPLLDDNGKVQTIKVGEAFRVAYPDQDLYAIGGRMTGYGFVETDKGTSLELHGDFKAQSLTPDHNGEVDIVTRGSRTILPAKAEKLLISQLYNLGYPVTVTELQAIGDGVVNGENGVSRTAVNPLSDPIQFAFIVGARQSSTVTGYEYTVKAVERAKKEAAASDMMLAAAMKKRKVLQLAAPGSKHAEA